MYKRLNQTSKMRYECDRVKMLVKDAIKRFFWEEQRFKSKLSIDALIGVTVDEAGMFYVSLNEVVDRDSMSHDAAKQVQQKIPSRKRPHHSVESQTSLMMECSLANNQEEQGSKSSNVDGAPNCANMRTELFEVRPHTKAEGDTDKDDQESIVVKQEIDDSWEIEQDDSLSSNFPHHTDSHENPSTDNSGMIEPSSSRTDLWMQESQMFRGSVEKPTSSPGAERLPDGSVVPPGGSGGDHSPTPPGDIPQMSFPEGYQGPLPLLPQTISRIKEQRRRSILPLIKKVELIEMSQGMSHRKLAEIFSISKTQVQSILRRREEILGACADGIDQSKKLISDRQCKMQDVNLMTWTWYKDMAASNLPVSGPLIQRQAMYFAQLLGKGEFKASNGWLQSFKQRHRIGSSNVSNTSTCSSGTSHGDMDTQRILVSHLRSSQVIAGDRTGSVMPCKQEVTDSETTPMITDSGAYVEGRSEGRSPATPDIYCTKGDINRKQFNPLPEHQNRLIKSSEISTVCETPEASTDCELPETSSGRTCTDTNSISVSGTSGTQTTQVGFTEQQTIASIAGSTAGLQPTMSMNSSNELLSTSCQSSALRIMDAPSAAKETSTGHVNSAHQTPPVTMAPMGGFSDLSGGTVLGMGGFTDPQGSTGAHPMTAYPHRSNVSAAPLSAGVHSVVGHQNMSYDYNSSASQHLTPAFSSNMLSGYFQGTSGVLGVSTDVPSSTTESHNNKHVAYSTASSSNQNSIGNPVDNKQYTCYESVVPGLNTPTASVESDVIGSNIMRHQIPVSNSVYIAANSRINNAIGGQGQGHLDGSFSSSSVTGDNSELCGGEPKSSSKNMNI